MDRPQSIIYNLTGQTLRTYPPQWSEGIPSSASAVVWMGGESLDGTSEFTPSVTVNAVSSTVNSATGFSQTNRKRVYISSTSGISAGSFYILDNQYSQRELVKPIKIVTNTYVDVEDDLCYDYGSGVATFKGCELTAPVDSTWVVTEDRINGPLQIPYKVIWAYTINSVARRHYTYFNLVRQAINHGVTIYDLEKGWYDIGAECQRGNREAEMAALIDGAFEDVRIDLRGEGVYLDQVRDTEMLGKLVVAKSYLKYARQGFAPGGRDVETFVVDMKMDYDRLFARILASGSIQLDRSTEGSVTDIKYKPIRFER